MCQYSTAPGVNFRLQFTRQAMLVGIQNYGSYNQLNSCHGDVDDMKTLLQQGGFEAEFIW